MAENYFRADSDDVSSDEVTLCLHLTFECNCHCAFCLVPYYKRRLTSDELSQDQWFALVQQFCSRTQAAKTRRIKITGGEPLLLPYLPQLLAFIKTIDRSIVVDITTNAYLLDEEFLRHSAPLINRISISIDSFINETIAKSGRTGLSRELYYDRVRLVQAFAVPLRVNTIVYCDNWDEVMVDHIEALHIRKWKLIQVFDTVGCKTQYSVTKGQFQHFVNINRRTQTTVFFGGSDDAFDSIYHAFAPDGSMFNLDNRGVNIRRNL